MAWLDSYTKTKWVEALRSGKYKQGRKALKTSTHDGIFHYCCLGVLAEILDPDEWENKTHPVEGVSEYWHRGDMSFLDPDTLDMDIQEELAHKNDIGTSFEEIARLIERDDRI